jgi:hypothetical protein
MWDANLIKGQEEGTENKNSFFNCPVGPKLNQKMGVYSLLPAVLPGFSIYS